MQWNKNTHTHTCTHTHAQHTHTHTCTHTHNTHKHTHTHTNTHKHTHTHTHTHQDHLAQYRLKYDIEDSFYSDSMLPLLFLANIDVLTAVTYSTNKLNMTKITTYHIAIAST